MNKKNPRHVAIVMDGNGRWAESRGLPRIEGHRVGVDVVRNMVEFCLGKEIPILSLFAFSRENWARPAEEVEFLMSLFLTVIEREAQHLNEQGVAVRFIGDRLHLSDVLRAKMNGIEALTSCHDRLILNVALNYTGRWDITQATQRLLSDALEGKIQVSALDAQMIENYLSTKGLPDPDLLIRTSGEQRISDFFLWQIAFTEFYFSQLMWPDFTTAEFEKALNEYASRERRYGLTSQQLTIKEEPPYV